MATQPRDTRHERLTTDRVSTSPTTPTERHGGRHGGRNTEDSTQDSGAAAPAAGRLAEAEQAHRQKAKATRARLSTPQPSPRHDPKLAQYLSDLSDRIGAHRVNLYLAEPGVITVTDDAMIVRAESDFVADLIKRRFSASMRAVSEEVFGTALDLRILIDPVEGLVRLTKQDTQPTPEHRTRRRKHSTTSDERHDLDRFIVGAANRMAYDAALRIANPNDTSFRQLFLHGPCGNGKTHLLRGIARRLRQSDPSAKIRWVAAEAFTNEYIQAIQRGQCDAFRKKHRGLDLLCIDDVHFVARKEATQNELVHTLEAIELDGARLVLASDEHPHRISDLKQALASRFVSGVVVEIQPPDESLAGDLITRMARERGLKLDPTGLAALKRHAMGDKASVRDLEGMIARLMAGLHAEHLEAMSISAELAERMLKTRGPSGSSLPVRFDDISSAVCESLSVEFSDLGQPGRQKRVVLARGMITLLCKRMTNMSYPEITRAIGKRNHSTVITAHQRIDAIMDETVVLGLPIDGMSIRDACDAVERLILARR